MMYLDDIIIFSSGNIGEHLPKLAKVFERLREANVKLKPSKCELKKKVKYLGHFITLGGTTPNPEKIKDIVNYQLLRNVKNVRAFLGLAGWYRKFISNFAEIAVLLTKLTKKKHSF